MKIMLVDDEKIVREGSASVIRKCEPDAVLFVCSSGKQALKIALEESLDIAFLDVEMGEMNGVELAYLIKELQPTTNIIFSTAHPQYAGDAMQLHASGYITKPMTVEKVKFELENLRHPIQTQDSGLRIHCFGNFEVFFNGDPIHFKFSKTKELLAYLVDRKGSIVKSAEIQSVLWEDEDHPSYYKQLRKDLLDTLKKFGTEEAIIAVRGGMGVAPDKMRCDYFDYLSGSPQGINAYHGEYMQQYSWSEMTHGSLENKTISP